MARCLPQIDGCWVPATAVLVHCRICLVLQSAILRFSVEVFPFSPLHVSYLVHLHPPPTYASTEGPGVAAAEAARALTREGDEAHAGDPLCPGRPRETGSHRTRATWPCPPPVMTGQRPESPHQHCRTVENRGTIQESAEKQLAPWFGR